MVATMQTEARLKDCYRIVLVTQLLMITIGDTVTRVRPGWRSGGDGDSY